jgi:uncharacterized RDD family membrane protein YckC
MTDGVYYARRDYAGFWRRLLVDAVDGSVVLVLVTLITVVSSLMIPNGFAAMPHVLFWSGLAVVFSYLVVLKRSPWRTLGYRLGGVRIVNLQGEQPSLAAMTLRAMFMFFGPLNVLIDALWLTGDKDRQSLRDKYARTYVIRKRAEAAGHGAIGFATYTLLGNGFLFAEVGEPRAAGDSPR